MFVNQCWLDFEEEKFESNLPIFLLEFCILFAYW